MQKFNNLYNLSKTLRFELIPIGETLKYIKDKALLDEDEQRKTDYKQAKIIIDDYHREFINDTLKNVFLEKSTISEIQTLMDINCTTQEEKTDRKDEINKLRKGLRENIVSKFNDDERFKTLFKKDLFNHEINEFINKSTYENKTEYINIFKKFNKFHTYFTGFNENRKNIYSNDKSTAISFRIIDDNLDIFIKNIKIFNQYIKNNDSLKEILLRKIEKNKEFLGVVLEDFFELSNFNNCISQKQIEFYNFILGGRKEESHQIEGLNNYLNKFRQVNKLKKRQLPDFTMLKKQILSIEQSNSFVINNFENDKEVIDNIQKIYENITENKIFEKLKNHFEDFKNFNQEEIYIKNEFISDISNTIFRNHEHIEEALENKYKENNPQWANTKTSQNKQTSYLKKKYFSLREITQSFPNNEDIIFEHINKWGENDKRKDLFTNISNAYNDLDSLINKKTTLKSNTQKIKIFYDSILSLLHFIKIFNISRYDINNDIAFYSEYNYLYNELSTIINSYNKTRNYLSKKPYSNEKFKLNFNCPTLANGWDKNKEKDNLSILLIKDDKYFLAIMNKDNKKDMQNLKETSNANDVYRKVNYKLLPGANKMLPKVCFASSNIDTFNPSDEVQEIRKSGSFKKGNNFNLKNCHKLIDFYKKSISIHKDWQYFNFNFSPTKTYEDISKFYKEVEQGGYKITFSNLNAKDINTLVDDGKLYLFQIYNKDFSKYSKGTQNLHTMYWKALFSDTNLKNIVYKLNGEAELFYRKASIKKDITHTKNKPIENKNSLNSKKSSTFKYDLIKDKRFTQDKFFFHVPITINFKASNSIDINKKTKEYIKTTKDDIKIIGIDRGERHLIYLSLINQKGEIEYQKSFNIIENKYNGDTYKVDYHNKLSTLSKDRDKARKNWNTIENIKELKSGFLSQVVHQITKLMCEHNAIVVLEDLNFGFKNNRFKIEKQVYQKFERALIEKLNFLVDKSKVKSNEKHLYNGLQLTSEFISFQKLGKQSGFLFYIPAWNTSNIDPSTGFVNFFGSKLKYDSVEKSQEFFKLFQSIIYNDNEEYFEFSFDYDSFTDKAKDIKSKWTICSKGERLVNFRNPDINTQWDTKEIDITKEIKNLFSRYNININKKKNMINEIIKQNEKSFFEKLYKYLKFTMQMRNSEINSEVDYMLSPIKNAQGGFFDTREYKNNNKIPENSDANGAYNIAKKGLWVIEKIKKSDNISKINLAITNKEWLDFTMKKPFKI